MRAIRMKTQTDNNRGRWNDPKWQKKIKAIEDKETKFKQLPLWPEPVRCCPNEVVRSALFNVKNRNVKRQYLKNVSVAIIGAGLVKYTGPELRMDDRTVWLELIHRARGKKLYAMKSDNDPHCLKFSPYSFFKAIGWTANGRNYKRLEDIIIGLISTAVTIETFLLGPDKTHERDIVAVSLIRKLKARQKRSKNNDYWQIWFEPEIIDLFDEQYLSSLNPKQYLKLTPLAQWLHGYYSSHSTPYAVRVETIMIGCGVLCELETPSNAKLRNFRKSLYRSFAELKGVGFLQDGFIKKDLVYVKRNSAKLDNTILLETS